MKKLFSVFPCAIIGTYSDITKEEIQKYLNPDYRINIIKNFFVGKMINNAQSFEKFADMVMKEFDILSYKNKLNEIASYFNDSKEEGRSRNAKVEQSYINMAIGSEYRTFWNSVVKSGKLIDHTLFPSERMTYWTFYDRQFSRKKEMGINDINDIMIAASTPYVDAIITEKHQCTVIEQNRKRIGLSNDLIIIRCSEFVELLKGKRHFSDLMTK